MNNKNLEYTNDDKWAERVWDCENECIRELSDFTEDEVIHLRGLLDKWVNIKRARKTSTTYVVDGETFTSQSEHIEVGKEGDHFYIHAQKDIGFSVGLIFTPEQLKKIRNDIDLVLKSYE